MKRLLVLIGVPALVTGCVSVENARNWQPQDGSTNLGYYDCLREAQQPYANAGAGSARSSIGTNDDILCACMAAKGYRLREPSGTETALGITFAPIWLPAVFLAKIGEGMGGQPPHHYTGCPSK